MSQITIKNISSATVVISVPEINFNRSLVPGRSIPITQEIYDNLLFEPGVQNMIRGGYITVSGVEEGSEVEVKKENKSEKKPEKKAE